jgi:CheY-like chemotaxis protein
MISHSERTARLILIEDNPGDVGLFRWALHQAGVECELTVIQDGGAALELIRRENRASEPNVPDLVILDLNLPKASGKEILAAMRSAPAFANVPVVIWTSSNALTDREQLEALRITRYLVKPSELREFKTLGVSISEMLRSRRG